MDPGSWERVKAVYHSALDRDPGERAAFLDQACRDDAEVLREVQSLLAQASGDSFLAVPAWQSTASDDDESGPLDTPARPHPFRWVVWVVTAALAAAFGYAAWKMPTDVAVFGWSQAQPGTDWRVADVSESGPAAGKLQPGDILVSLDGDPNVARVGTQVYSRTLAIGASYRIRVARDGATYEYVLQIGRGRPDLQAPLLGFLLGLAWCLIGVFIGFARPQDAMARLAFLSATLTGFVFLQVNNLPAIYALQPLHGVLGYHFFYRFPGDPPRARGWKILLWLLYAGTIPTAGYFVYWKWLAFAQGPRSATLVLASPLGRVLATAMVCVFGAAMLAAVVVAIHNYRAVVDLEQRRRFQWVALGGVVGLMPEVPLAVLTVLRADPRVAAWLLPGSAWLWFNWAVSWCSVTVPLGVAYAVVKHQVFDVRVAIRRGVQYLFARRALQALLALPTGALIYTLVVQRHRTIAELVKDTSAYLYFILALGLSLKFRAPLFQWLDRKFFREHYDGERVVLSLADELARLDSVDEIPGFVCGQVENSLHPKSLRLWWREDGAMRLANTSDSSRGCARFHLSDALLEKLKLLGTAAPVPLPDGTGVSDSESRWLTAGGVRLIVPVAGTERVEGVLLLGEKQSEEPYSDGDVLLVHAVAQQTAVVLDNFRLKGRVRDEERIRHEVLAKLDRDLVSVMRECPACGACYDTCADICGSDGSKLVLTLPVSRTIDSKYRLDRLIGRGGMGAVYEARDLRLDREVAVKVMLGGGFGHDAALRRFRREAQAVARLSHPNIVALHDCGELEGGGAYLVMERLHGATLRAEMKRVGVFTPAETAEWFEQLLDGLAAAHECGVVHRDLKPENIVGSRRASGSVSVKILDFGLAKLRSMSTAVQPSQSVTESGVVLGTRAYMAPEQLLGQEVDARADIYTAGVILVEMLTGRRPFEDGLSLRSVYELPLDFPNRAALDVVLRRCLAAPPPERFFSAIEMRGALIPALYIS